MQGYNFTLLIIVSKSTLVENTSKPIALPASSIPNSVTPLFDI